MSKLYILAGMAVENEKMFFALALEHHLKRRGRGSMSSWRSIRDLAAPDFPDHGRHEHGVD